jgi:hypothetical protein
MESSLGTIFPHTTVAGSVSAQSASAAQPPAANAADIGEFVVALLAQGNLAGSEHLESSQPKSSGESLEVETSLPYDGQGFTLGMQTLPLSGLITDAPLSTSAVSPAGAPSAPVVGAVALRAHGSGTELSRAQAQRFNGGVGSAAASDGLVGAFERAEPAPAIFLQGPRGEVPPIVAAVATLMEANPGVIGQPETGVAASSAPPADVVGLASVGRSGEVAQSLEPYLGKLPTLPVAVPDVFAERMHQQLSVMISNHAQHARIAVNPPELGPVEIRVSVVGDEATVHLAASHAATREALEDALPRLRAAFSDSGIALENAGVFSELPERPQAHQDQQMADSNRPDGAQQNVDEQAPPLRLVRIGLVDAYA